VSDMAKKSQVQKFRETARAVEASEDEEVFNSALRRVAKADPKKVKEALDKGDVDALAEELGQTDADRWHKK
jgi:hypothetical protein